MRFVSLSRLVVLLALFGVVIGGGFTAAAQQTEVAVDLPDEGESIEVGDSVEGELEEEDVPLLAYTFEAEADTPLTFIAEPSTEDFFSALIIIYDEDGEVLATSEDNVLDDFLAGSASVPYWIAPEDGTYFLAVSTALYAFYEDDPAEGVFTLTVAEAETETIALGDTIEGLLNQSNRYDLYVFEVEDADIVRATIESDFEMPVIGLDVLTDDDFNSRDSNGGRDSAFLSPIYLPTSETVVIAVFSESFSSGSGNYTLVVERYEPDTLTAEEPATVEISVEYLTNYLRFEGVEDDVITISSDTDTPLDITLVVFDPDGRAIAAGEYGDAIEALELLEDGTYTLMIFPTGFSISATDLGEVEVTLEIE